MMVVVLVLDTSAAAFLLQTRRAVGLPDIAVGLIKSVAYAQAIALMACHHGLRARGGADGVGRRTTSTVVAVLVLLVAIDAVITIAANQVGL
jgi:phospholipid/cholesterol/gamma-HCH transport system permease protein